MGWTQQAAGLSDVGCHRSNNEDSWGKDDALGVYVVCDGMGGAAAGEVASKLGVETMLGYFRERAKSGRAPQVGDPIEGGSERAQALSSALQLANTAIRRAAVDNPAHNGMGSTVVSVLVGEDNYYTVGHVGDSRVYLWSAGELRQLTSDHSLVNEQLKRGLITPEQAKTSDVSNIILRALGADDHVRPDISEGLARDNDVLLLCSDGLTREIEDPRIAEILGQHESLEEACAALIAEARANGGHDNITALLLRFRHVSFWRSLFGG